MQKKPHNFGETVIKQCALAMARIVLGEKYEKSLRETPLSNNTVKRRITLLSLDIKDQVKISLFLAYSPTSWMSPLMCPQSLNLWFLFATQLAHL